MQPVAKTLRLRNLHKEKYLQKVPPGLPLIQLQSYAAPMPAQPANSIAVIFVSQRTDEDEAGYHAAGQRMIELAREQPGYLGMDSARGLDGVGITISYWTDACSAKAWRDHPEHRDIRKAGRDRWYSQYDINIACVERSYEWKRD